MEQYGIIAEQTESTIVAHWDKIVLTNTQVQTEAQLEAELIRQLREEQGYGNPKFHDEKAMIENLRQQLQKLNNFTFTDGEWQQVWAYISNDQLKVEDKAEIIQRNELFSITLDNGDSKTLKLIDKKNIHNNILQVINQYVPEGGAAKNRYDVTILVNGLPLVHIELKRRGISIKEAFNQINRYQKDTFWGSSALYDYVQIFVISNGTQTKYYSNTTRYDHVKAQTNQKRTHKIESNSFEFTCYWADKENNKIEDLVDFAATFFKKSTLLNVLTKYCVFNTDRKLMVMRPYQIAATEAILQKINIAVNNKDILGTPRAGGYIWHTTGSGKTLTSFKTAQLASAMPEVAKVIFIVDRQDLDYQTMKEYDRFEKDCANGSGNSNILMSQLKSEDPKKRILVTTIQKMTALLKKKDLDLPVLQRPVVMIFDECHRSQFGDMHTLITKRFKKYMLFGFTGTPIFPQNSSMSKTSKYRTTEDAFGEKLHTYTIITAIRDKNVLPFHIDYLQTIKAKEGQTADKEVSGIETHEALFADKRIEENVKYLLEHFNQKTKRNEEFAMSRLMNVAEVIKRGNRVAEDKRRFRTRGFNSILAVESVPMAIKYYNEFMRQKGQDGKPDLRIATIYTFAANEEEDELGYLDDENPENAMNLDPNSRDALEQAITNYNTMWTPNTNYALDSDKFQAYYKDISLRMKNREIDLLIVVGMFLTGFDAVCCNTLWVDKPLKMHGLLQAFSRTNRIMNSVKNCGNIVCFRNLEQRTNESLALFGDENARGVILLKTFWEYYSEGYIDRNGKECRSYKSLVEELLSRFPVEDMGNLLTDEDKKDFVKLLGYVLQYRNLLSAFDEFTPDKYIIDEFKMSNYLSYYNDIRDEVRHRAETNDKESILDDIEFEVELVKDIQVSIDYILQLVQQYKDSNCVDKELLIRIRDKVKASPDMRSKQELIDRFIDSQTPTSGDVTADWNTFVRDERRRELDSIIEAEGLKPAETIDYVNRALVDGYITTTGTAVVKLMPPMPMFGAKAKERSEKKQSVIDKLQTFFEKYYDIIRDAITVNN